ncbi:hypothetical protein GC56T2_0307 [Geobacillus sp. C56-T2]|nr:hypothetical protein GC56T2_0307 [Geobacillus sp. C56-T2]
MPPINVANTNDISVIYSSNMVIHSFGWKVSRGAGHLFLALIMSFSRGPVI